MTVILSLQVVVAVLVVDLLIEEPQIMVMRWRLAKVSVITGITNGSDGSQPGGDGGGGGGGGELLTVVQLVVGDLIHLPLEEGEMFHR